jgi:hypothetical protein
MSYHYSENCLRGYKFYSWMLAGSIWENASCSMRVEWGQIPRPDEAVVLLPGDAMEITGDEETREVPLTVSQATSEVPLVTSGTGVADSIEGGVPSTQTTSGVPSTQVSGGDPSAQSSNVLVSSFGVTFKHRGRGSDGCPANG